MPIARRFVVSSAVLLSAACVVVACVGDDVTPSGPGTTSCTPGTSTACVGPGGCAGGQTCNAQGSGYGACDCSTPVTDSASNDSGGSTDAVAEAEGDSAVAPTEGALRVTWTLKQQDGGALGCGQFPGARVSVVLTDQDAAFSDHEFQCTFGQGDILDRAFGLYTYSASLVNDAGALGYAPTAQVELVASPCDQILAGDCAQTVTVVITEE